MAYHISNTSSVVSNLNREIESPPRRDLALAVDAGEPAAQLRIRFEVAADNDGRQDLALFYRTESNTNEAGIFELAITQIP